MQYTWLFIVSLFWMPLAICHAETREIKDAEFVIEKQKKNRVNQEQRLFFKAPARTTKNLNKPLQTVKALVLEEISFDPVAATYLPFGLKEQGTGPAFNHYCRLGIGSLWLPYLEVALENCAFKQTIWSTKLAFVPELWNNKSREASLALQGKYGMGSWLLQPNLKYQHAWHKYNRLTDLSCRLHQGKMALLVQQASASSMQEGQVSLNLLNYHHKKISEQLLTLKYKWVKQLDNWSLKIASYNDIAGYTNDSHKQTRCIFSVTPSLYLTLPKAIRLKAGLRMAYHSDPIPGKVPSFDLYPMVKIGCLVAPWFAPYIGIKGMGVGGSVLPLYLHDIVAKNPFIATNWKLSYPHQYLNVYGGSKGIVSPHLSYHLHIAYRRLKNLSRIVAVSQDQVKLDYHPEGCNVLKITGFVDCAIPNTKFNTTVKGNYYCYFDHLSQPVWWYHKPAYKLKPALIYRPYAKVLLSGKLHLHGPTVVKDINGGVTQRGRIINLSLGMDYFICNRFTAFLMVGNLFNRKDISYTGYPDKKINITGGLQYRW